MSTTHDTEHTTISTHRARVLEQVQATRALCDFVEEHADVFPDYALGRQVNIFADDAEALARLAIALGGQWTKAVDGGYFSLNRDFGGPDEYSRVSLSLNTKRENVCERVRVGTETRRVPDPELVAEIPLVEIEEPVFEWRCPDSLLDIRPEDFTGPVVAEREENIPW